MNRIDILLPILLIWLLSCKTTENEYADMNWEQFYDTDLFHEVQQGRIFEDSKTFVDCSPKLPLGQIIGKYDQSKDKKSFDLHSFIHEHFEIPSHSETSFSSDTDQSMRDHIISLWPSLTREPDQFDSESSIIPLPHSYVVPGGRFREIYYWDSYFTMEGLMKSGKENLAEDMLNNFTFLIDSLGFIPNGNRSYYLSRSQPPFYALMLDLVYGDHPEKLSQHESQLLKEYNYFMHSDKVVPKLGAPLNVYWDDLTTPRPESYKEDYELVIDLNGEAEQIRKYRNIRAAAASGWDFSSRWMIDGEELYHLETTDIIPVDLNCLLYFHEVLLAKIFELNNKSTEAEQFRIMAEKRKTAIQKLFWSEKDNFFMDYYEYLRQFSEVKSMAGVYPLFFNIATEEQAKLAAETLENEMLKPGGFVTTNKNTGQQWDAPNGWAPLQWMAFVGLKNYGYHELAEEAASRWLRLNRKVFKETGKMMEKYNVVDTTLKAGGGEYPNQDGFGWTNGVALSLMQALDQN